jgi:hypothetical protein
MSSTNTTTGEQLASALQALGVKFIVSSESEDQTPHIQPARLIAALAESREARLRLSLIPLFLEHPEFAMHVRAVTKKLAPAVQLTLQCYYSAAVWLRQKYKPLLKPLPDYFSTGLNLSPTADPDQNLLMLAKRHKELSGTKVNWLGTYEHAAQLWLLHTQYK